MQVPSIDPKNIVFAHMSKKELDILSRAQGGPEWNEYVNCPQLFRLGEMIKMPKIRKAIEIAAEGFKKTPRNERDDVERDFDAYQNETFGPIERIPDSNRDESNVLKMVQSKGRRGDTEIVAMPENLFNFLVEIGDGYDVNPETGLPEFGFWSGLLSVVGGIAGSFIPGVGTAIGAAIGSGVGNLAGGAIDEWNVPEKKKSGWGERLINAGLAGGAAYLGGKGYEAFNKAGEFKGIPHALPTIGDQLKAGASSLWDTAKGMLPYASTMLMAKGAADDERAMQNYQEEKAQNPSQYQQYHDQFKRPLFNSATQMQPEMHRMPGVSGRQQASMSLDDLARRGDIERNRLSEALTRKRRLFDDEPAYKPYKKGGYIKGERTKVRNMPAILKPTYLSGNEKGQDDNIYVDVPHGSEVIDATTVAHLGDGSSEAGGKLLTQFAANLESSPINHRSTPMVPCALSAGEFVFTPDKVKSLGHGSLQRGHKVSRKMVKLIRESKQSSASGIPPKALSLDQYFEQAIKAVNLKKGN